MAQKKSPLLDLTTQSDIERDYILIDGEPCPIRSVGELGLIDYSRLMKMGKEFMELFGKKEIDENDLERCSALSDELLKFIFVDTPKETLNKLTDLQIFEVIGAFMELLTTTLSKGVNRKQRREAKKIAS